MTKVIDCFTFFNELDLLEFRLRLLSDVVDKFVVCESNITHSGKPKPYYYYENKERFSHWKDKIIHVPIEQSPEDFEFKKEVTHYDPTNGPFLIQYQHRDGFQYAYDYTSDDDIVLIGDLDEFPDPNTIASIKQTGFSSSSSFDGMALSMEFHYYYMNCRVQGYEEMWQGTVVTVGSKFKNSRPQYFRDNRNLFPRFKSGWHFSYLGGPENVKRKIQSIAHVEFDIPEITSEENIKASIDSCKDVLNRPGKSYKVFSLDNYPEYLKSLMVEYPQFIKDVS